MNSSYVVYILRCADGTLYTGITNNTERRLKAHNAGTASKYTRVRRPVEMVYQEMAGDKSAALKRELQIKALTRTEKEELTVYFSGVSECSVDNVPLTSGETTDAFGSGSLFVLNADGDYYTVCVMQCCLPAVYIETEESLDWLHEDKENKNRFQLRTGVYFPGNT